MTRRLRDPAYLQEQLKGLYAAHVKPVNKLVGVLTMRDTDDEAFAGTNAQRKQWRDEQKQVFLEAGPFINGQ